MVKVISKKPITIHEAREILEKAVEEIPDVQQDSILKRTLDYLNKFAKIDGEKARKIVNELIDKAGLSEEEAVEIVNLLPRSIEELRTLTVGWRKLYTTEQLQKILEILETHR